MTLSLNLTETPAFRFSLSEQDLCTLSVYFKWIQTNGTMWVKEFRAYESAVFQPQFTFQNKKHHYLKVWLIKSAKRIERLTP